ncbi:hypothetical protein [Curtobacterium luteum]|uniref:hypothetical protein n=1 Tax=Curtobacterium luteum TaxID=33881 RepID=UPI0038118CED
MLSAGLSFAVYVVAQGPILQAEVAVGSMGRVSALTSPVLAIASITATAVSSRVLSGFSPEVVERVGYPAAIASAAALMGVAGIALIRAARTIGSDRGRAVV